MGVRSQKPEARSLKPGDVKDELAVAD
jgi:hypothetical protein